MWCWVVRTTSFAYYMYFLTLTCFYWQAFKPLSYFLTIIYVISYTSYLYFTNPLQPGHRHQHNKPLWIIPLYCVVLSDCLVRSQHLPSENKVISYQAQLILPCDADPVFPSPLTPVLMFPIVKSSWQSSTVDLVRPRYERTCTLWYFPPWQPEILAQVSITDVLRVCKVFGTVLTSGDTAGEFCPC